MSRVSAQARSRLPIQDATLNAGRLELTIDGDHFMMTQEDHKRALLIIEEMRPWRLARTSYGNAVILGELLNEPEYPQEIRVLREQLRGMVKED